MEGSCGSDMVRGGATWRLSYLCIFHTHEVLVACLHGEVGAPHNCVIPPAQENTGGGGGGESVKWSVSEEEEERAKNEEMQGV